MWPWEHLAFGYLGYTVFARVRYRRPPTSPEAIMLALGTQFPDVVDKPLAWSLAVLPSGRSLAHSLFTAFVVIVLVKRLCARRGYERSGTAFGVGYGIHLLTDLPPELVWGEYSEATYLLWPLLPPPDAEESTSIVDGFAGVGFETFGPPELVVLLVLVLLWLIDGAPGLDVASGRIFGPRRDPSDGGTETKEE